MTKIQSRSGSSLAGVYDVKGGIAGLDELRQTEVGVVHEMGGTIFSERFQQTIRLQQTVDNQSTITALFMTDLPAAPWMLHGVSVLTTDDLRLVTVAVNARDPISPREIPLWVWGGGNENVFIDFGSGTVSSTFLTPVFDGLPRLMSSSQSRQFVSDLVLRLQTTAFGAGTVTTTMLAHISLTHTGDQSNRGLPIPSW